MRARALAATAVLVVAAGCSGQDSYPSPALPADSAYGTTIDEFLVIALEQGLDAASFEVPDGPLWVRASCREATYLQVVVEVEGAGVTDISQPCELDEEAEAATRTSVEDLEPGALATVTVRAYGERVGDESSEEFEDAPADTSWDLQVTTAPGA